MLLAIARQDVVIVEKIVQNVPKPQTKVVNYENSLNSDFRSLYAMNFFSCYSRTSN